MTEDRPVCSVCIANFNGERLLVDCIDSVLNQRGTAAIEIIVHDDASSDGSVALLRERYPGVRLLLSTGNVGFCIANNRMVAEARGDYVLLLNNDAALLPDAIETLLAGAHGDAADSILTLPQFDWESGQLVDRGCMLDPFFNPVPNLDPAVDEVAYVIGACLWCRREVWNSLGGFPEWMESLAEDLYLCAEARLRGLHIKALPGSGYRHRRGASFGGNRETAGLTTTYRRRRLSERNKTGALVILTPGPAMWILLATHLLALSMEAAIMTLLRRDARLFNEVYWPAIRFALSERRALLERRRRTQSERRVSVRAWFRVFRWWPRKLTLLRRHGVPQVR